MATIDDLGGAADSLGSVPLGGPSGWAAAVRDAIKAIPPVQKGRAYYTGSGSYERFTFPVPFTSPPSVVCNQDAEAAIATCVSAVYEIDATGFSVALQDVNDTTNPASWFTWIAVGSPAS